MDTYELAEKWLSENERRFHCAQMNSDEIALSAFVAGFEAAQHSVQLTAIGWWTGMAFLLGIIVGLLAAHFGGN